MDDEKVAVLAGGVTLAAGAARTVPRVLASRVAGDLPELLEPLGTAGEAATVALLSGRAVGSLAGWVLVLAAGVYLGRRVDVRTEYRRLLGATAAGAVGALVVAAAGLAVLQVAGGRFDGAAALTVVAGLLGATFSLGGQTVVGLLAAAAFASLDGSTGDDERRATTEATGRGRAEQSERVLEHATEEGG